MSPVIKYRIWLVLFVIVCIPLHIQSDFSWENYRNVETMSTYTVPSETITGKFSYEPIAVTNVTAVSDKGIDLMSVLQVLYITGVCISCSFFVVQYMNLRKNHTFFDQGIQTFGNRTIEYDVVTTTLLNSPAVMGIFRNTVLLPEAFATQLSEEELKYIYLHESMHVKQGDQLFNVLLLIYKGMFWFNPLTHITFKLMKQDMEYACDYQIRKYLCQEDRKRYGHTLLNLASYMQQDKCFVVSPLMDEKHVLKTRINMLIKQTKYSKVIVILLILALGFTGSVVLTEGKEKENIKPLTTSTETSLDDIVIDKGYVEPSPSKFLTMEQAESILEFKSQYEHLNDLGEFYVHTIVEYMNYGYGEMLTEKVYSIEDSGGSQGLYVTSKDDKILEIRLDEFNGFMSTNTIESDYVLQYMPYFEVSKIPKNIDLSTYDSIESFMNTHNLKGQKFHLLKGEGRYGNYVYRFTDGEESLFVICKDEQLLDYRYMQNIHYSGRRMVPFSEMFYTHYDYDYLREVVLPQIDDYVLDDVDLNQDLIATEGRNVDFILMDQSYVAKFSKDSGRLFYLMLAYSGDSKHESAISQNAALAIANDYISRTPLKTLEGQLEDVKFEYLFDSQEKEYYVFEYHSKVEKGAGFYIKVNTFYECVTEITWFW